jgi:hypothetical protein
VVERRLRHSETGDIGEVDLIRAAPERVLRGLAARARLADGGPLGTPVASPDDIFHALASVVAAPWSVRASRKRVDGSAVLRVGLLRSACGLTQAEIRQRTGLATGTVGRYLELHRLALRQDERYRTQAVRVAKVAVRAALVDRIVCV